MNAIFYMWLCRVYCWGYKHWWFRGRILAWHAGDRGSIPPPMQLLFLTWMQYFIYDCAGQIVDVTSIGGSVVEFSPATRETVFDSPPMQSLFFTWMQYFICDCAGKIVDVISIGGSVVVLSPATRETGVRFPANATFVFNMNAIFYIWLCRVNCWG